MPEIRFSRYVRGELAEIALTIAEDQPDAAERFLVCANQTFELLAEQPRLGRVRRFSKSRLKDLRSLLVKDFEKYLIFYQPISDGIEVFHVYHGARDLEALFDEA